MEDWRDTIEIDYPNYMISCLGRVKNTVRNKVLKPTMDNMGYYTVKLSHKGVAKTFRVHQLVANAFLEEPDDPTQTFVDHINNVRTDNNVGNLRWTTQQQNNMNRVKQNNTSSQYKGVTWDKAKRKWSCGIKCKGKRVNLGRYDNEKAAARRYNEVVDDYFGEYGFKNEISDSESENDDD